MKRNGAIDRSGPSIFYLMGLACLFSLAACDTQMSMIGSPVVNLDYYSGSWKVADFENTTQTTRPIDLVWLVDSDKDMQANRDALVTNAQAFIQQFTQIPGLDWQAGVLSTNSIAYTGFTSSTQLNSKTSDPVTPFVNAVKTISALSNGPDEVFVPVQAVLSANPGFVRSGANLALILVTNAPDSVDDSTKVAQTHYQNFVSFLTQLKSDPSMIAIYPILKAQDFGCPPGDDPLNYAGSSFQTLVGKFSGKAYALCSPSFGTDLVSLAGSIVQSSLSGSIKLGAVPYPNDASAITVTYKGQSIPQGVWQYDKTTDTISFSNLSFVTDPQSTVNVVFPVGSHTSN